MTYSAKTALTFCALGLVLLSPTPRLSAADLSNSVSLSDAADQSENFVTHKCRGSKADGAFWTNPNGDSRDAPWEGAQAVQGLLTNYEATKNSAYLGVVQDYSDWLLKTYGGKDHLTLCETWPKYDTKNCKPIGDPPSHPSYWSDDAGWAINLYFNFYQYTTNKQYLDLSYQTLLNCDKRWGVDFLANSRGLRYYDHHDQYSIYMSAVMIGALSLYDEYHKLGDQKRADRCFKIVSGYYNYIESYLHSSGAGNSNITNTPFTLAKDLYQVQASFKVGCLTPKRDAVSYLGRSHFTACQMMMAAVYVLMDQAERNGANLSLIDSKFRNFHERAVAAADAFVRDYPEGYLEQGIAVSHKVIVNAADSNVNGFGCYYWVKYIVPLDPQKYGAPILSTARSIVENQGTGDVSSSLWNSPKSMQGRDPNSYSVWGDSKDWVFVRDCSACSIIAAARWIMEKYGLTEQ